MLGSDFTHAAYGAMTGLQPGLKAGMLAAALLTPGIFEVRAQSNSGAEGGLFELLQSGDAAASLPTGEGNVISLPVGEPEDRLPIYRTMCVRLCDGYYFPMSPSSSRNDFARDQQNCRSACPGAETRLYYQPSGEPDADAMTSAAADEPYRELATAGLYKRPEAPEPAICGCRGTASADGYTIVGGQGTAAISRAPGSSFVYSGPPAEPEAADDAPADVGALLRPTRTEVHPSGERRIRVVGPEYLPGRAAAGARPVPAPTTGR